MKNETIETLRHSLKITKKAFSEELGITQTSYTNYIQGKREIPTSLALKMQDKYDISIDWLLSGKGNMKLSENDVLLNGLSKIEQALYGSDNINLPDDVDIIKLTKLLEYAPPQFISKIIDRLEAFKEMSNI